jgi:antitoxin (DNA-binding transcriptional repressor) of toxin-antitoxin stability system
MEDRMHTIDAQELQVQTLEILRRVREQGETVEVSYLGEIVARLVPVAAQQLHAEPEPELADLENLRAEIASKWPAGVSAVEAVREVRRG